MTQTHPPTRPFDRSVLSDSVTRFYSSHHLLVIFGIDPDSLEEARRNGRLRAFDNGLGDCLRYRDADLLAWTQAGAPTAPAMQPRDTATTSHTSRRSSPPMATNPKPTTARSADPIVEVAARVDALVVAQGMSKKAAHKRVMKNDSDLRCRYVVAFNKKHGRTQRAWDHAVANS